MYADGSPVISHQWPEFAGFSEGAASIFEYVGAGCPTEMDSFWRADACCAAVARAERLAKVASGIGVFAPVFASVWAFDAIIEAA